MKHKYDVIVVGAGPAGSSCAGECAKRGLDVLLIERDQYPGKGNVCGGLLPPSILKQFKIPSKIILRKIRGYKIFSPSGKEVKINFSKKGAITSRQLLDDFLAKDAVKHGAELMTSCNVEDVSIRGSRARTMCVNNRKRMYFESDCVVAADGPLSNITKGILGDIYSGKKMIIAMQEHYKTKKGYDYSYFKVFHDPALGYGLGWLSPRKNDVVLGAGVLTGDGKNLRKRFDEFRGHHRIMERVGSEVPHKKEGGLIPFDEFPRKLYADRFMAIGDAGMLCNPFSGDGVHYALESGLFAAETIAGSTRYSEKEFRLYQDLIEEHYREVFTICHGLQKQMFSSHKFAEQSLSNADEKFVNFLDRIIWNKKIKRLNNTEKIELMINVIRGKIREYL